MAGIALETEREQREESEEAEERAKNRQELPMMRTMVWICGGNVVGMFDTPIWIE